MKKAPNSRREKFIRAVAAGVRLLKDPEIRTAIASIQAEGRKTAAYDLARAMEEAQEVIDFAKANKNAMAYFKAVEHRTKLSGLLIEEIHLKSEVVDLTQALAEAKARTQRVTATVEAEPIAARPTPPIAPSEKPTWSPFEE